MSQLYTAVGTVIPLNVLGFRSKDIGTYGCLVTNIDGGQEQIIEHADAAVAKRATGLCLSSIVVACAERLPFMLNQLGCDYANGGYQLADIVSLARQSDYRLSLSKLTPWKSPR